MDNEFIDGYIFGPNDLSGSINEIMDVFGDNTQALIKEAVQKLKAKGKYIGLSTGDCSAEVFKAWSEMGVDMLSADADFGMLVNAHKQNVAKLTESHKK
jgi:2-dehydro-3-deoxyglucarate aldolase/4-hydroxy-2-oxoheptanedioate aldolase